MKFLIIGQLFLALGVLYIILQPQNTKSYSINRGNSLELVIRPQESDYDYGEKYDDPDHKDPVISYTITHKEPLSDLKGSSDDKIAWIYKTNRTHITLCQEKNPTVTILCDLGIERYCQSVQISEALANWWIICPIYTANVPQTAHLYELHQNFKNYIKSYGINFQTVEIIFPGQEFQLTKPNNQPFDLQYHAEWIFAMRENLVNVGIKHLPGDWEYVAWIDQHIFWKDSYWFEKSIWLFSHYNIVHMLESNDLWNMENKTHTHLEGFAKIYAQVGIDFEKVEPRQCGIAWGTRREIFEELGGLLDICIGSKCDLYMNYAYVGLTFTKQAKEKGYIEELLAWQTHAGKVFNKSMGYLDSNVVHFEHCTGDCWTSTYESLLNALVFNHYDPKTDLYRDKEGRIQLVRNLPLAERLWQLYGGRPRSLRRA